jgi:sucrose-6-phosphate hydrolase SacC (GH32 family)
MILGSGTRGADGRKRGCVLRYSSPCLQGPWAYEGVVAKGAPEEGRVWECPALLQVSVLHNMLNLIALVAAALETCVRHGTFVSQARAGCNDPAQVGLAGTTACAVTAHCCITLPMLCAVRFVSW